MKCKIIRYFIFFLAIVTGSCEKDVKDVVLPPFEQKLIIASFISPSDSVSYVFVSSNRKIYGELGVDEQTGNLSGTISDGTTEVALDTALYGLQVSRDKMPIRFGRTYSLKITSDKGLSASASCLVPGERDFNVSIDTFSIPLHYFPTGYPQRRIDVKVSIQDIPGEENFYRVAVKGYGYKLNPNSGKQNFFSHDLSLEKEFFADSGIDGKNIIVKSESGINYYYQQDSAFIKVYIYNTEKSYYLYHKSLDNYRDENPFAEVSPVYSNVTGGLGIFSSYTIDSIIYRIK
jgi:hypothetical protein